MGLLCMQIIIMIKYGFTEFLRKCSKQIVILLLPVVINIIH